MKISAFCLVTNATKFGYPFIESIKSWLPVVDELVIIDGGSKDGTVEMINDIGSSKIRIISDEETYWGQEWVYCHMGKSFNRGFKECTGDMIIKFDVDYVLHEEAYMSNAKGKNLRMVFEEAYANNDLVVTFTRLNFIMVDRYFFKRSKTLATNKDGCRKRNILVKYGLDIDRWAWGYEPIMPAQEENGLIFGDLLNVSGNAFNFKEIKVFNYGFAFSTKEQINWIRQRHIKAETRQQMATYKHIAQPTPKIPIDRLNKELTLGLDIHIKDAMSYSNRPCTRVNIEDHPKVMQDKLKNLNQEQQGYNMFGLLPVAKYYENEN